MGRMPALALVLLACCGAALGACGGGARSGPVGGGAPAQPRGMKGERIGGEPASSLHLSRADCGALARAVKARTERPVRRASRPEPPLSRCRLSGRSLEVNVYLDTAHAAHQRYENRMVEQAQFGAPDQALVPHPVGHDASWVPAFSTLFAARGGRFLTVAYSVGGWPHPRRLRAAASLARRAFALSRR